MFCFNLKFPQFLLFLLRLRRFILLGEVERDLERDLERLLDRRPRRFLLVGDVDFLRRLLQLLDLERDRPPLDLDLRLELDLLPFLLPGEVERERDLDRDRDLLDRRITAPPTIVFFNHSFFCFLRGLDSSSFFCFLRGRLTKSFSEFIKR